MSNLEIPYSVSKNLPTELQEWLEFLDGLEGPKIRLSRDHADRVKAVWCELRAVVGIQLSLPQVTSRDDGQIVFAWSYPNIYVEIEIHSNGTYEWFAKDRLLDLYDGSSKPHHGALDESLLKFLQLLK